MKGGMMTVVAYHFGENKPKIDLSLNVKNDTFLLI